jgi:hypothetical protein
MPASMAQRYSWQPTLTGIRLTGHPADRAFATGEHRARVPHVPRAIRSTTGECAAASAPETRLSNENRRATTNATLSDVRKLIRQSEPDDWHRLGEGPTYRSRFEYSTGPGEEWRLKQDSHHTTATYKPDVHLTIAYGLRTDMTSEPEFEWAEVFADHSVVLGFVDIFWGGSLIDRVEYVSASSPGTKRNVQTQVRARGCDSPGLLDRGRDHQPLRVAVLQFPADGGTADAA